MPGFPVSSTIAKRLADGRAIVSTSSLSLIHGEAGVVAVVFPVHLEEN